MIKLNQSGQTLIEALIALAAATVIVAAISIAVITAVNNSDFSKYQNLATQYSQQGMELMKQKSQSNWGSFSGYSGTYCLAQNSTNLTVAGAGCTKNIDSFFIREVVIAQGSASCGGSARVTVSVAWADGKCTSASNPYCHDVTLDSCLANIDQVPTPY